jgi:eukaryotic-like serine/threonine-protein kinase
MQTPEGRPLVIGQQLGDYRIEARLGSGGMGVVYRAYDPRLQRPVAIKILDERWGAGAGSRLLAEARAASALNHPHICTVHEAGEAGGRSFIVMELVDGRPLSELIPHDGLPLETLLRIGVQVAEALAHAHERGVLHRDLKTPNVVLTGDGRAKVLDFGLARRLPVAPPQQDTRAEAVEDLKQIAGTLAYMPPEALRAEPATPASDVWSLGVVLYEMASGRQPFRGRTQFELMGAVLRAPAEPLPAHVPASLRTVILRCLAKEPGQRYRGASEVAAALEAIQSGVTVAPPAVPRRPIVPGPLMAAGAGLAALALAGAAFMVWRDRGETPSPGRMRLLVSSEWKAEDPALSPDGRMLVYVGQDETGQFDLYATRATGGAVVRLTNDAARESRPQFSPDGERVAFARRRPGSSVSEVAIVPALGGEVFVVLSGAAFPVWSPDGSRLAVLHRAAPDRPVVLATMRLDGSDYRELIAADQVYPFLRYPAWSPDGRMLAIVRGRGGVAAEIWLVSADGREPVRRLSEEFGAIFSDQPVFTPDGRGVIHSSNRGGATNIWQLPLDRSPPMRLTTGAGPDVQPTVAASGAIAFRNSRWRNVLLVHELERGATRSLFAHAPFIWSPAFSPDGRELAFSRAEVDGRWHVWIIPVAGGTPRRLTSSDAGEIYARYTPDGRYLLFQNWNPPRRVWKVPRDGAPPVPLTPEGMDATFADVSPDGRRIVFCRTIESAEHLYTMPVEGGEPQRLGDMPGTVPRWSPDGQWIAFAPDRGTADGIFVIRPDGTGLRRLTATGGWPVWWGSGAQIGFLALLPDGDQQIRSVTLEGGDATVLDTLPFQGTNHPFDVSPDTSLIATSDSVHVSDEIWLLEPGGGAEIR